MSDFKAKMHQIRFRLGLRPRPPICPVAAYPVGVPPDPLAQVKGTTSMGRKGNGRKGGGRGREGKRKGRKGEKWRIQWDRGTCPPLLAAWQFK